MITRMWLSLALTVATVGAAHAAEPAAPDPDARGVAVKTSDLDLSRSADAQVMLRRLRDAASTACGGAPSLGDLVAARSYEACMHATLDNAVASLNAPVLTALYEGRDAGALAAAGGAG